MGHDLLTIYWLKAVEYVLALSYLPLFILFWKFVNPAQPAAAPARVPATAAGWADQLAAYFTTPATLFYHPGHAWARVDGPDTVTIGVTDFAQRLVGPLQGVRLPAVGSPISQGESAFAVRAGSKTIDMLAPVDGTVLEVNARVTGEPGAVNQAPYGDGWLMKVRSEGLARNLKHLMTGVLAQRWMETVTESLGAEMAGAELGAVYADGGVPVEAIARSLDHDHWDRVARRFFLTEQGGPHA